MNTKYGKIIDGVFEYAPTNLEVDLTVYKPAPDYILEEAGYKSVETVPYPDDGNIYASSWTEDENVIRQVWVLEHSLTPTERREKAYQEDKICEYEGAFYTCDEIESLAVKYLFEDTESAKEIIETLRAILTTAKKHIRELYSEESANEPA